MKHQIEFDFEKDINEIELMKAGSRITGVVAMIKDDFYGPRKYVVAVNTIVKLKKLIE
jgi:hypothetical protein